MKQIWRVLKDEKQFRKMTISDILSGLGSWFSNIAVIVLLFQLTGVSLALGITLALRTVPLLIFGPIGGYLADRYNKKYIIVTTGLIRALLVLSLLAATSASDVWIIYTVTILLASLNGLSLASKQSIIPKLVHKKNLPTANSINQSIGGAIMTLGSALGGVVSALIGTDFAFISNSLMFLLSSLIILRLHYFDGASSDQHLNNTVSFVKILRQSTLIKLIALQSIIWPIGGGTVNVLIGVYGYEMLNAGETGVGFLYASLGIGFLISGIISPKSFKYLLPIIMISTIVEGLSHMGVSQSPTLFTASMLLIIGTVAAGIGNIYVNTLTMKYVPENCLGRVFSLNEVASSVVMTLSMVSAGFLLEKFPPDMIGLSAGLVITLTSLTVIPLFLLNLDQEKQRIMDVSTQRS